MLLGLLLGARFIVFSVSPFHANDTHSIIIEVKKGTAPNEITRQFVLNNIIEDGRSFVLLGRLTRQWKNMKAGEYKFSPAMSPLEIFSVLTSGVSVAHPITIREGENIYEIGDDLQKNGLSTKAGFLSLCRSPAFISTLEGLGYFKDGRPASLEGYLFPDTYFLSRTQTPQEMIRLMVKTFYMHWSAKEEADAKSLGMTRHQVITLASIIEKETGAPQERPVISSVFHNRLRRGMKLQSDPTTIYGIWERYDGNIHKRDLTAKNDYNTYSVPALPIGPISNPGHEAIQAALHPAESTYLFFVSHNDGTHQFSTTNDEHNQAVRKYQLDPRAREGKSWRNLQSVPAKKATR